MTIEIAFGIALSLVAFFGSIWVASLQLRFSELKKANEALRAEFKADMLSISKNYQTRDVAERNNTNMNKWIDSIRTQLDRIETKIDRKADK